MNHCLLFTSYGFHRVLESFKEVKFQKKFHFPAFPAISRTYRDPFFLNHFSVLLLMLSIVVEN